MMIRCTLLFILATLFFSCKREPDDAISYAPEAISVDESVYFTTYRNGTRYSWNFGDGSSEDTPTYWTTHTYSSPGNYSVSVVATDTLNQTFTSQTTVSVRP